MKLSELDIKDVKELYQALLCEMALRYARNDTGNTIVTLRAEICVPTFKEPIINATHYEVQKW